MKRGVPPYLSPGQIAKACGISRKSALTELRNAGLIVWRKGRIRISRARFRERLSDMYDDVWEFFETGRDGARDSDRPAA